MVKDEKIRKGLLEDIVREYAPTRVSEWLYGWIPAPGEIRVNVPYDTVAKVADYRIGRALLKSIYEIQKMAHVCRHNFDDYNLDNIGTALIKKYIANYHLEKFDRQTLTEYILSMSYNNEDKS